MASQTILITGASVGIGRALAREFARDGYRLILTARRIDLLEQLAAELRSDCGVAVETIALDLTRVSAARELYEEVNKRGLAVDVLVNNAGFGVFGRFAAVAPQRQRDLLQLNICALTELCSLFLPPMLERGCGGILNVASIAAFQAGPNLASYYASKAYVLSLTEALRSESGGRGLNICCLAPGPTFTEFTTVAGMRTDAFYRLLAMSPEQVACAGYRGFRRNRALIIPGIINKLGVFMTRLVPRALSRTVSGMIHADSN